MNHYHLYCYLKQLAHVGNTALPLGVVWLAENTSGLQPSGFGPLV